MTTGYKKNGKFIPTGRKKATVGVDSANKLLRTKNTVGVDSANKLLRTKQTNELREKKTNFDNEIGYNVKLKKKEKILNAKHVTTKNGRHAIKGVGSDGTVMYKFIKAP